MSIRQLKFVTFYFEATQNIAGKETGLFYYPQDIIRIQLTCSTQKFFCSCKINIFGRNNRTYISFTLNRGEKINFHLSVFFFISK